jgi:hypothetical protein
MALRAVMVRFWGQFVEVEPADLAGFLGLAIPGSGGQGSREISGGDPVLGFVRQKMVGDAQKALDGDSSRQLVRGLREAHIPGEIRGSLPCRRRCSSNPPREGECGASGARGHGGLPARRPTPTLGELTAVALGVISGVSAIGDSFALRRARRCCAPTRTAPRQSQDGHGKRRAPTTSRYGGRGKDQDGDALKRAATQPYRRPRHAWYEPPTTSRERSRRLGTKCSANAKPPKNRGA